MIIDAQVKCSQVITSAPKSMAVNLSMLRPGSVESKGERKLRTAEEVAMTSFKASLLCVECSGPESSKNGHRISLFSSYFVAFL